MSGIYGNGVLLTEKMLDCLWGRQTLTLNNIANVDTPGFKSQYITFEQELAQRIGKTAGMKSSAASIKNAIEQSQARVQTTWNESTRLDGNNVDMDQEQVELVRTTYEYQYMVSSLTNELNRLKSAAKTF